MTCSAHINEATLTYPNYAFSNHCASELHQTNETVGKRQRSGYERQKAIHNKRNKTAKRPNKIHKKESSHQNHTKAHFPFTVTSISPQLSVCVSTAGTINNNLC